MKLKRIAIAAVTAGSVSLLAGCMSSGPKVTETREVNLPKEAFFPTPEQVQKPGYKIAILPVEYNSRAVPQSLATLAYDTMTTTLKAVGNDVIERDLASRMESELRAAALNGEYSSNGIAVADVVAIPEIASVKWSSDYDDSYRDDDGDYHPATCQYTGTTDITVSLYLLPEMTPLGTHPISGESSFTREENDEDCPLSDSQIVGLWKTSTERAASKEMHPILNQLAPNYYVMGRRDASESESIFKINYGVTRGAATGLRIDFYRRKKTVNPLTGKQSIEDVFLGSGNITEDIGPDYAYVAIDEPEVIDQLRLGTMARVYHDGCDRSKRFNLCDVL